MYIYRHYNKHTIHTTRSVINTPYILLDPTHTFRLHVLLDPLYVYDQYGICTCIQVKLWQIHYTYSISVISLHHIIMNTINILQYLVHEYMINTAYVPLYPDHILWIQYTYFNIQYTFYKHIIHTWISSMCTSHCNTYITHMFKSMINTLHILQYPLYLYDKYSICTSIYTYFNIYYTCMINTAYAPL